MEEIKGICRLLDDVQQGECWIGVNMKMITDGLTPEQALHKIDGRSNCIWQLINHVRYWRLTAVNRLKGSGEPPGFPDMLLPSQHHKEEWEKTLREFDEAYHVLRTAILQLKGEDLVKLTPRGDQTFYQLLHGVIEHDCYHMGQMMMIKKYAN